MLPQPDKLNFPNTIKDKGLEWLFSVAAQHPVTQFLRDNGLTCFLEGLKLSPMEHAAILPYKFSFKDEGSTFRYNYVGSAVEALAGTSSVVGQTLNDVLAPQRLKDRYASLRQIKDGRFPLIQLEYLPLTGREHVEIVFVGLPMPEGGREDITCFLFKL